MDLVKFISSSASETENIGKKLAKKLKGTEVISLFGGLGAGKTAFTRGLSEGLGFEDGVSSPTFALVHEYEGKFPIFHFDMYRVTTYDDLYSTGFFDYIGNGILVIEWKRLGTSLSLAHARLVHSAKAPLDLTPSFLAISTSFFAMPGLAIAVPRRYLCS